MPRSTLASELFQTVRIFQIPVSSRWGSSESFCERLKLPFFFFHCWVTGPQITADCIKPFLLTPPPPPSPFFFKCHTDIVNMKSWMLLESVSIISFEEEFHPEGICLKWFSLYVYQREPWFCLFLFFCKCQYSHLFLYFIVCWVDSLTWELPVCFFWVILCLGK